MRALLPLLLATTPAAWAERVPVPGEVDAALTDGATERAFILARDALADCERAERSDDTCLDLLIATANLARKGAAPDQAEQLGQRAVAEARRLAGDGADSATALNNLALLLDSRGRLDEAAPLYRRAIQMARAIDDAELEAVVAGNFATGLEQAGRLVDAEPLLRRVRDIRTAANTPQARAAMRALGTNLMRQSRYGEAEAALRPLVEGAADGPQLSIDLGLLAKNLQEQGRLDEALALRRRALAIREQVSGPTHFQSLIARSDLATTLLAAGRHREAEAVFRAVLAADPPAGAPEWLILIARSNLARTLDALGRPVEAEPLHRAAADSTERLFGPSDDYSATIFAGLAANLAAQGQVDAAEEWHRRALAARRSTGIATRTDWIEGHAALARFLVATGRNEQEARTLLNIARRGVEARMAGFTDFGPAAQRELTGYRRIYADQVAAAWALARQPR